MPITSDIRVSVDVGCQRHRVAIGLPSGKVLAEFDVEHRPEAFDRFFQRIDHYRQRYGGAVAVAMEGYNGWARPLDTLVRERGYRLFNINNLKLARFRRSSRPPPRTTASMRARVLSSFSSATICRPLRACCRRSLPHPGRTSSSSG
jgi:hypothetical protein